MKEIFTEEEYKDVVKKCNEMVSSELYENIENYPTYKNYINLKDCALSDYEFKLLWKCQELLSIYDSSKHQVSENICIILDSLKEHYDNFFGIEV